jgi:hypothetical protein
VRRPRFGSPVANLQQPRCVLRFRYYESQANRSADKLDREVGAISDAADRRGKSRQSYCCSGARRAAALAEANGQGRFS